MGIVGHGSRVTGSLNKSEMMRSTIQGDHPMHPSEYRLLVVHAAAKCMFIPASFFLKNILIKYLFERFHSI